MNKLLRPLFYSLSLDEKASLSMGKEKSPETVFYPPYQKIFTQADLWNISGQYRGIARRRSVM